MPHDATVAFKDSIVSQLSSVGPQSCPEWHRKGPPQCRPICVWSQGWCHDVQNKRSLQVPKTGSKNRFHTQISAEQIIAVFFLVLQATCRLSRRCRDFRVPRCHSFWWRCYMCRPRLTIQHRKCCAGHMPPHIINVNDTRQPWQLLHGLATLLLLLGIQVSCGGIHIMSASRVKACNLDKGHRLCRCANLFFTSQTHWIYLSTSCFF